MFIFDAGVLAAEVRLLNGEIPLTADELAGG